MVRGGADTFFWPILPEDFADNSYAVSNFDTSLYSAFYRDTSNFETDLASTNFEDNETYAFDIAVQSTEGHFIAWGEDKSDIGQGYDLEVAHVAAPGDLSTWHVTLTSRGEDSDGDFGVSKVIQMIGDDSEGVFVLYVDGTIEPGLEAGNVKLDHIDNVGTVTNLATFGWYNADMVADGSGGVYVLYSIGAPQLGGANAHGSVRHYTSAGMDVGFGTVAVSNNSTSLKSGAVITTTDPAGAGGDILVFWLDNDAPSASNRGIYGQKISSAGALVWNARGEHLFDTTAEGAGFNSFTPLRVSSSQGSDSKYIAYRDGHQNWRVLEVDDTNPSSNWSCAQNFGPADALALAHEGGSAGVVAVGLLDDELVTQLYDQADGDSVWALGGETIDSGTNMKAVLQQAFFETSDNVTRVDASGLAPDASNGFDLIYSKGAPENVFTFNFDRSTFSAGPGGDCTPPSAPDAIDDLSASTDNTQIFLSWSVPFPNGSAITDYVVEYGVTVGFPGNAQVFSDGVNASTGATVTGLTNGTEYSFRVTAVNGVGTGPSSNVVTATPAVIDSVIEIHVASTLNNGFDPMVTGISDGPAGTNDITSFGPTTTDYSGARRYQFAVNGDASEVEIPLSLDTIPSPTVLDIEDEEVSANIALPFPIKMFGQELNNIVISDNGFIYLNDGPPSSDGTGCCEGQPMDTQDITAGTDFLVAGVWQDLDTTAGTVSYGIVGTAPNRAFVVYFNDVDTYDVYEGQNTFQIKLFEVASATAPDVVTDLNATAGDTQVTLTWSAPADNGSAITDYIVEYGAASGFPGNPQVFSDGVNANTGATVTGLTNDTEYSFRVAAVNGVGQGPYSNVDTATPTAGGGGGGTNTSESEINIDVNDFLSFSIENIAAGDEPSGNQPFGAGSQITALIPSGGNAYAVSGSFGTPVYTRLQTTTNSNDGYNVIAYASNVDGRTNTLLRGGGTPGIASDEITDSLQRVQGSQVAGNTLNTSTDTGIAFRLLDASTSSIIRESDEDTQWGDDDTTNALWFSFPLGSGAAQVIYDTLSYSAAATTAYINWFVGISSSQQSGSYSGQVTFTATVN